MEQGQAAEPQQMEGLQHMDLLCMVSMEAIIPGSPWWPKGHERIWIIVLAILLQNCSLKMIGGRVRETHTKP